jgi:hypothetical protein
LKAIKGVADFKCIGTECEDTCCASWDIVVDDKTKAKLESSPLRSLFHLNVQKSEIDNKRIFKRTDCGQCSFLNTNHLCHIHSTLDETYTPLGCQQYPRLYRQVMERNELSSDLSCPEIVRLVILNDTGADWVDIEESPAVKNKLDQTIIREPKRPWVHFFPSVRELLLSIVGNCEDHALAIYRLSEFCRLTVDIFNQTTQKVSQKDMLHLHNFVCETNEHPRPNQRGISALIHKISPLLFENKINPTFVELMKHQPDPTTWSSDLVKTETLYAHTHPTLQSRWIKNWLKAEIVKDWYVHHENLHDYILKILLKLFVIRCCLTLFPVGSESEYLKAIVQSIYRTHRVMDHNPSFVSLLCRYANLKEGRTIDAITLLF